MFKVVIIMFIGVIAGVITRKLPLNFTSKLINPVVWILLGILGIEIGLNDNIFNNLSTLGIRSLIITFFAILGSCIFSWLLWKWITNNKNKDNN